MLSQAGIVHQPSPRPPTRYLQYQQFEEAWDVVLKPWFKACEQEAWRQAQPVAIVVPNATTVAYIKERLLAAGLASLGVQFLTPGTLRSHLLSTWEQQPLLAIREDLHLMARIAASALANKGVAQAVLIEPNEFVKACDALESGGWGADAFAQADVRALATAYFALLDQAGLHTVYRVDRALRGAATEAQRCFSELLMVGFTAQHWSQFNLLASAPYAAANTLLCLPLGSITQAEVMWQSQWEQAVGSPEPLYVAAPDEKSVAHQPYLAVAELATRYAGGASRRSEVGTVRQPLLFWLAPDLIREAAVITEQIIHFLGEPNCDRLAVVFANRVSPLAREVGEQLLRLGILHHHIPGHYPGQTHEQAVFECWVEFQTNQRLQSCIQFFRTLKRQGLLEHEVFCALEKALLDAFRECMTDDLNVLLAYVTAGQSRHGQWLTHLHAWARLPQSASFTAYFQAVQQPLARMAWPPRMDLLQQRASTLGAVLTMPIQREAFLGWLRSVVHVPGRMRAALGREPFARVQLTTLTEAAGQSWSHVIVAGMNQGVWPPEESGSAFLSEQRIAHLNRAAAVQGAQGKGHEVMAAEHSYMLAPHEQRCRYEEDFFALIGSVRQRVACTASAMAPDGSGKAIAPSDLWMRVYYAEHGKLFGPVQHEAHLSQTELFLRNRVTGVSYHPTDFSAVHRAFTRRRARDVPFDDYSFCFKQPPTAGIRLSCKAWETAYKRPALAWYEHIMKARPKPFPANQEIRALTVGTWLHDWVNPTPRAKHIEALPRLDTWQEQIEHAAEAKRAAVTRAYQQAERALPDWWHAEWAWTRRLARQFSHAIAAQQPWSHGVGEFTLRPSDVVAVPGILHMQPHGRIDLVLGQHAAVLEDNADAQRAAWIIDFKTGADAPLTSQALAAGDGIQLALYALALHGAGVDAVAVSILRPDVVLQAQLTIDVVLEQVQVWKALERIHQSGCFGDRGAVRSAFGFTGTYPLATLPVDPTILEEKWQLTFNMK